MENHDKQEFLESILLAWNLQKGKNLTYNCAKSIPTSLQVE